MLVIRLQRTGRRNIPAYRLVIAEKRAAVKGKVKEYIGHYLPTRNPHEFVFKKERIEHWLKFGAQPSNTVARLLKNAGMTDLDKFIKSYTKKKKRKEKKEEKASEAKPDKSVETPHLSAVALAKADAASQDSTEERTEEKPAEEPKAEEKAPESEEKPDDTKEKKE